MRTAFHIGNLTTILKIRISLHMINNFIIDSCKKYLSFRKSLKQNFTLGAVHKRRSQSEGKGGCPVRRFFGQRGRGLLQMRTSALFGAKNFGFFEFYGQGKSIFRDFVRTSFMDGPLEQYKINSKLLTLVFFYLKKFFKTKHTWITTIHFTQIRAVICERRTRSFVIVSPELKKKQNATYEGWQVHILYTEIPE